jgi:hypothetical protein
MIAAPSPVARNMPGPGTRRRVFAAALAVLCFAGGPAPMSGPVRAEAGQPVKSSAGQTEIQILEGRWVRPDGGYVLALGEVTKEGSVKASYFNPRLINVSRAEVRRVAGALTVVVELRDINYPGSTYTLRYDPASDRLKGAYFQAVEKQTYVVEFVRAK